MGAFGEELFVDLPAAGLYAVEAAALGAVSDGRRMEFASVRHCARRAMAGLGLPAAPVVPSLDGAPQWPAGVVGSMTHCSGYRAAALARSSDLHSIGIDAEPHGPLPGGVLAKVALPSERAMLHELSARDPRIHWDRVLFTAKESTFKAWFPLARSPLGFNDAEITLHPERGTFEARLRVPGPLVAGREIDRFHGRWTVGDGLAISAITVSNIEGISDVEHDRLQDF
ncbi:4'-phosphopantetheinyl transferase [Streptomyces sp. NPDC012935]|uniref:4'-phosphopantetheinyl transferase family protein n=1 Tax=Streptomyces sp. NPDC012935 TaxID=3364857 RepID=UPI0036AEB473